MSLLCDNERMSTTADFPRVVELPRRRDRTPWQRYRNLSGNSPIRRYSLDEAGLNVEFAGGGAYRYDYHSLDPETLATLKRCAVRGEGLATHIRKYAYHNYAYRLR